MKRLTSSRKTTTTTATTVIAGLALGLASSLATAQSSPGGVEHLAALDIALPAYEDISTTHPVFDFDGDGCFPSAGIGRDGQMNGGLATSGSLGGDCRESDFLKTSNTLHRYACKTVDLDEYCGHSYALYFMKDQVVAGADAFGHRHDWEHAMVWTKNGNMTHGAYSAHGDMFTKPTAELPLDSAGRLKIVYHKDGGLTHSLRFAKSGEIAENPYGAFVLPPLTSWFTLHGDSLSNQEMRNRLNSYDYGSASIPSKDSNFVSTLNSNRPAGYPQFDQNDIMNSK